MRVLSFILIIIFLSSCSKEDESCKQYYLVTESNQDSALDKCEGYANNYPAMQIISREPLGCLNKSELEAARKSESKGSVKLCDNVFINISITIKE